MKKLNVLFSAVALAAASFLGVQAQEPAQPQKPAAVMAAPVKAETAPQLTASVKKISAVQQRHAQKLLGKVEMKKDAAGVPTLVAREGKKLGVSEKLVVKKVNKQLKKAEAKGGAFKDWNKYLRIGVILLAVGLVLNIISWAGPGGWSIAWLFYLVWLAGLVLTVYGLGLQLDWW